MLMKTVEVRMMTNLAEYVVVDLSIKEFCRVLQYVHRWLIRISLKSVIEAVDKCTLQLSVVDYLL